MGSLDGRSPSKRDRNLQRSSSVRNNSNNVSGFWGFISRCARLVCFRRLCVQLICAGAVFFFFIAFLLLYLPGVKDDVITRISSGKIGGGNLGDLSFVKELDYGEDLKFEPSEMLAKFQKDSNEVNESVDSRNVIRFGYKKPKLALVFADLWADPHQIKMVTIATALRESGYEIEVLSLEDGPLRAVWGEVGFRVSLIAANENMKFSIDWLNYNGILVNSLKAVGVISSLMQEPFRNVPLVWTIHEQTLAVRLSQYVLSEQTDLVDNWKKLFSRSTVIVFPNYILPMAYSLCDTGNYFVIPGSPSEAWKAEKLMAFRKDNPLLKIDNGLNDFVVAVVGSQLMYKGLWLENALVLKALHPLLKDFGSRLKIIVFAGRPTSNYSSIVETIARNLKYPNGTVNHIAVDEDADIALSNTDLVIYGSFLEEHTFPDILLKAMCLEKPIIAPDLPMISKYVSKGINVHLFPRDSIGVLKDILLQLVSNGELSLLAHRTAAAGKSTAKNLMVSESVEGYASLLENILVLPSEVSLPKSAKDIPIKLKNEWQWRYFEAFSNETKRVYKILDEVEKQFNHTYKGNAFVTSNETFEYSIWEEQEFVDMDDMRKRREDDELKERTEQPRGTWDEIYKNARRSDRTLHERDEGELERTGQPLCIYEPYFGEGTWPFLHSISLYRGLGLSTKGRRPGYDDVDAPSRLPLLNDAYYRDVLGEYGAFFAIANRIDRIHKNAWIGFQSWRATARMKSLSKTAERSLLDAIEARRHGDTFYFWACMDTDPRNRLGQDFWSFCDAINAGNCQHAFSEALKEMYGIEHNLSSLPPMPSEGTWSVMHSWALPTKSFMEFVMFSRMFVDTLDAQFYDKHQKTGRCYLSLSKDNNCYSRMLELLVNVWAYHSARRMVYVDPTTGFMKEQHKLNTRRGKMWIKWFEFSTLKKMDEDLAQEFDPDRPKSRSLWPSTGEIYWQGIYEKERDMMIKEKERKKQQSKEKIQRMKKRARQKALGKYVKPNEEESNSTTV